MIRRLLQAVLLLFILSIGLFLMVHALPGGPERIFLSPHQTKAARDAIIHNFGLDQPLYIQYFRWITGALHGDFGVSFVDNQTVISDIGMTICASGCSFLSNSLKAAAAAWPYSKLG